MRKITYEKNQKIGKWIVIHEVKKNNRHYYKCQCACGTVQDILASVLNTGKSNGCTKCSKTGKGMDLSGQDFGFLHVEENVIINNHTYCRCSCKCGGSTFVTPTNLKNGYVTTCGCRMDVGEKIKEGLSDYCIDGTYVPGIRRTSLNKNNTSGIRGVSYRKERNKYRAYIKFQRKNIFLGNYDRIEDAAAARKIAELEYFGKYMGDESTQQEKRGNR